MTQSAAAVAAVAAAEANNEALPALRLCAVYSTAFVVQARASVSTLIQRGVTHRAHVVGRPHRCLSLR